MVPTPYVYERELEHWTSNEIERFFENRGFDVAAYAITGLNERKLPTDFIFIDDSTCKLFGFQYKALYHNANDFWKLDKTQHNALQSFDWIYYGLSNVDSGTQRRDALNRLSVVSTNFVYDARLTRQDLTKLGSRPLDWARFFEGLRKCKYGRKITSRQELKDALWPKGKKLPPQLERIANEIFVVDFANRRTSKFSPTRR